MSPFNIYIQSFKNTHNNLPLMYDEDEISHAKNCYLETHVMGKSKEYQAKYEYISSVIPEFMSNKSYETYLTACLLVNSRLNKK